MAAVSRLGLGGFSRPAYVSIIPVIAEVLEQYYGGWYRDYWEPTKDEIKKERERLGITKKEIDQIVRVVKKVGKGQLQPSQMVTTTEQFFVENDLTFANRHDKVLATIASYMNNSGLPSKIDQIKRASRKKHRELQEELELKEYAKQLKIELQRIASHEEEVVLFIISMIGKLL